MAIGPSVLHVVSQQRRSEISWETTKAQGEIPNCRRNRAMVEENHTFFNYSFSYLCLCTFLSKTVSETLISIEQI